jgi:large subunit ribosomal protein L25
MKSVAMSGSLRANVGKKDAKALRNKEMVPCVLYGGDKQVMFAVEERAFKHLVFTPEVKTVDLDIDGAKHTAILQEIQQHPVTDRILHADFLEVATGKDVTVSLPLKFEGTSPGVRSGGKLIKKLRKLSVRGPIEKMPEHITLSLEKLEIGDTVRVKDMEHEGLTFLNGANMTVVTVQVTRNVVAAADDAAAKGAKGAAPAAKGAAAPAAKGAAAPAAKPAAKK